MCPMPTDEEYNRVKKERGVRKEIKKFKKVIKNQITEAMEVAAMEDLLVGNDSPAVCGDDAVEC